MSVLRRLGSALLRAVRPSIRPVTRTTVTRTDDTGTVRISAPAARDVVISYAPDRDGAPDAGEIVWTWVPYEENDGRGKDRPVLVIGTQDAEHVYAVRLTSTAHDADREFVAVGTGEWDSQRRPSWVDVGQLYSVHVRGLRREASALDRRQFSRVADALHARYGWRAI
ncbi:type II toxin-antitoxin system PemK/MazF family toxin [Microbacterium sp. P05]|uniref:type II toxin-antitoxin system PemK/MazF family toxin n=1 Tax=Microbacterium sp. P05 TaxID=3366948 RepID=UPI003745A6E9